MARTPLQIKAAFYAVLKSDTAGTAVRAALGNGASSVIEKEDLKAKPAPAAPFVALQWGVGGGPRTGTNTYFPTWWLYDDAPYRHTRLEALIALIEAAYPENAIGMCYVDFLPVRELTDAALSRPAKGFPFQIRTRG
jgi:hypothetical protein